MDIKNSKMRKLILSFLFVLSAMVGFAQSFSKDKLFISVECGKGVLFGKSNLSPFGIGYRGVYDGGLMCNVKALYRIDMFWVAGLKFNLSGTSANYGLDDGTNVADNVDLWYLGPQLGFKIPINERTFFSYVLGVGYLHYRNEGRSNADFKCSSGAFAGNMDFGIEYKLTGHLAVNGGFSILTGDFKKIKMTLDDVEETLRPDKLDRIYVRRLDFQLGLIFCF